MEIRRHPRQKITDSYNSIINFLFIVTLNNFPGNCKKKKKKTKKGRAPTPKRTTTKQGTTDRKFCGDLF